MESWRVVCVKLGTVKQPKPHTHIIGVGTGDRPDWVDMRWTFPQVLVAMMEGDVFYTRSETSGRVTPLITHKCPLCGGTCLRSLKGSAPDNDLDEMRNCVYEMEVRAESLSER
jgi:hypothetical protein